VPIARHQREFWERAFREVERGAKISEVARRLGVRAGTLSWWCWKLRGGEPDRRRECRADFLPLVLAEQAVPMPVAAVEVEASGVRLRLEVGTDVEYVSALVAAIRRKC
jgi:transposase-like protein